MKIIKGKESVIKNSVYCQLVERVKPYFENYIEPEIVSGKNILIVAPGITVKDRLSVLFPSEEDNFYKEFRIVDDEMNFRSRPRMLENCTKDAIEMHLLGAPTSQF